MKQQTANSKQLLTKLLMVVLFLTFVNCQKEDFENVSNQETAQSSDVLNVTMTNWRHFSEEHPKASKQVLELQESINLSRGTESSIYGFTIDTTSVQVIPHDGFTTFAFYIIRPEFDPSIVENYMYKAYDNGEFQQYLLAYDCTIADDGTTVHDAQSLRVTPIEDSSLLSRSGCETQFVDIISETTCIGNMFCSTGTHSIGSDNCLCQLTDFSCTRANLTCYTQNITVWSETCSGGNSNPDPFDPFNPNGGGNPTIIYTPQGPPTISYPVPHPAYYLVLACINGTVGNIDMNDQTTISMDPNLMMSMAGYWKPMSIYLQENGCSEEAQAFTIAAFEALADDECAILPTVLDLSEIEADFDLNLFGDYPAPALQQNHDAIQQQFNNLRNANGNLAAVNYLISTYNMNTFGPNSVNFNYSISFENGLSNGAHANAIRGFNSNGIMISCNVEIDINLLSFVDFGYITRVIKHELLHVLQGEYYGADGLSNAAGEFDAYYSQIFRFTDLKQIQDWSIVEQLAKYLDDNMDQLSNSERAERQDMINRAKQQFPKICNDD